MVYESDFYTVRRPYSRPTLTSYTVTGTRPVITIRTLIPPSNLHGNVRMSVLLGELNRIQHRPRPRLGKVPMEDYLCSRPMIEFDDEAKLIRAQADRLMRYVYTKVPTRERHPFGVLTTYDRHYTVPDDRYSSPKYLQYRRDIPSNILSMSYYYEPSRVTIGRGHLSCVSYAGGRGYPRRKHLYSDENRDIGDEIRFRSYYNKIMNPKSRAEALLLPTGFASRLLLTERNRYDPQEDSRLLFITPIKKSSGVSKERRQERKKIEAIEEKPRDSASKRSKKEIKEEVEKIVPSKLIALSPEPEENVECSATVRISRSKSPQPQEAPEPLPVNDPVPETPKEEIKEPKKPSKKGKKDSKVERLDLGSKKEEADEVKAKEPETVVETVEKEAPKQEFETEKETPKQEVETEKETPKQEIETEKETPKQEVETEKETWKEDSQVEEVSAEPPSEVVQVVEEIPVESNTPEVQEPVTPADDIQVSKEEVVEVIEVEETPSESKEEAPVPIEETSVPQPEAEQIEESVEAVADSTPDEAPAVTDSTLDEAPAVVDESEPNIPDTSNVQDTEPASEEVGDEPAVEEVQQEPEDIPVTEEGAPETIPESDSQSAETALENAPVTSDVETPAESEVSNDPVVE